MPDDELSGLADEGRTAEARRPEGPGRADAQGPEGAGARRRTSPAQWLQLRDLLNVSPDTKRFPNWDDELRKSMIREAELFFENIVKEDRPITGIPRRRITRSSTTGWPGITAFRTSAGTEFRKVTLPDGRRGGILTQAGFLTLTSNPTRTSPVKRGKWVYENILGLLGPAAGAGRARTAAGRGDQGHAPPADGTAPGEPGLCDVPCETRPVGLRAGKFRRASGRGEPKITR